MVCRSCIINGRCWHATAGTHQQHRGEDVRLWLPVSGISRIYPWKGWSDVPVRGTLTIGK
jgi:hypothetical protein